LRVTTTGRRLDNAPLRLPPRHRKLERDAPALREAKELDVLRLPEALTAREVLEDSGKERDRRCGVRARDRLAEVVEGGVPLVSLFVEEKWDPVFG